MERSDLGRLSKPELIDLMVKLQQPAKTSRTSTKPATTGTGAMCANTPTPLDHRPTCRRMS